MSVGAQSLVLLLLALGQVMTSTCPRDGPLIVVEEDFLEVIPVVDGVWLEALQPCDWGRLQGYREVNDFGGVGAAQNFYGLGVALEPLLGSYLAVVLGDANRLEILGVVLVQVEPSSKHQEAIART